MRVAQFIRTLTGDSGLNMRSAACAALAVLLAIPVGRDAAMAWSRSERVVARPSLQADPFLRLRWMEGNVASAEEIRTHAAEIRLAAKQLLSASPLQAMAMRQLGVLAGLEQQSDGTKKLALAERISRRDLPTQFALIEQAALNDDLEATLAHYDRALLVHASAESQLFPVLSQAISDADVRAALHRYSWRGWFKNFLDYAGSFGADPVSLAALLLELRGTRSAADLQPATSRLLARLVDEGKYAAARDLIPTMPDVSPAVLDTFGFSEVTTDPRIAPLSWVLHKEDAVEAEAREDKLFVRVSPERSALVAERTTLLGQGRYALIGQIQYETDAPPARLEWTVTCIAGSDSLVLAVVATSTGENPPLKLTITVPRDCQAQKWQLRATAGLSQSASIVRIAGLTLAKE